jgi:type IV pilus assembly protein PilB
VSSKKRLGELLLEAGVIGETQLNAALGHQRQWGVRLGQALVDLKLVTEPQVVRALAEKFGFDVADLSAVEPHALAEALRLVPREFAVRNNLLPLGADTTTLTVAMSDPSNLVVADELRFRTNRRVRVCIAGDQEIATAIRRRYPTEPQVEPIAIDESDDDEQTGETMLDPFGGGTNEALEAFFGRAAPAPPLGAPTAARPAGARPPVAMQRPAAPPPRPPATRARPVSPPAGVSAATELELTPVSEQELAAERSLVAAVERLARGIPAVKGDPAPASVLAAAVRLLLAKGLVTADELASELRRR